MNTLSNVVVKPVDTQTLVPYSQTLIKKGPANIRIKMCDTVKQMFETAKTKIYRDSLSIDLIEQLTQTPNNKDSIRICNKLLTEFKEEFSKFKTNNTNVLFDGKSHQETLEIIEFISTIPDHLSDDEPLSPHHVMAVTNPLFLDEVFKLEGFKNLCAKYPEIYLEGQKDYISYANAQREVLNQLSLSELDEVLDQNIADIEAKLRDAIETAEIKKGKRKITGPSCEVMELNAAKHETFLAKYAKLDRILKAQINYMKGNSPKIEGTKEYLSQHNTTALELFFNDDPKMTMSTLKALKWINRYQGHLQLQAFFEWMNDASSFMSLFSESLLMKIEGDSNSTNVNTNGTTLGELLSIANQARIKKLLRFKEAFAAQCLLAQQQFVDPSQEESVNKIRRINFKQLSNINS